MDASEYNSSTLFSDSVDGSLSIDVDQTEDYSLMPSRNTFSETDITAKSISDGNRTTYEDDYTSAYDSGAFLSRSFNTRTFNDSSSPGSPLSDELSSTFASFYLAGESSRKIASAAYSLRFPILFFSLVFCGSGGIGAVFRVVHAVTIAAARRYGAPAAPSLANNLHTLPDGYPYLPSWMQRARLSIPSVVESLVKGALCFFGVPALADLQKERLDAAMEIIKSRKEEVMCQTAHIVSGPMVPLAIFLPVFSFSVMSIARGMVAKQETGHTGDEDVEEEYVDDEHSQRLATDDAERLRLFRSSDYSAIPYIDASVVSDNVLIRGDDDRYFNHQNGDDEKGSGEREAKGIVLVPRLGAIPETASNTNLLADSPKSPNTVPTSRDLSPITPLQEEVAKRAHEGETNGTDSSFLQNVRAALYSFKGEVVAALAGNPTVNDANVLLVAASKYNFSRLILPSFLPELSLVSLPMLTQIERVSDVMQHVMSVEEPRGLTTVGVFLRPVTDDTIELSQFTHPTLAVYIFWPAAGGDEEDVLPILVEHRIYSTSSLDESIPVNACFYDRYAKEKIAGTAL